MKNLDETLVVMRLISMGILEEKIAEHEAEIAAKKIVLESTKIDTRRKLIPQKKISKSFLKITEQKKRTIKLLNTPSFLEEVILMLNE